MKNINLKVKYAYFIGIGGIGMSALARWFNFQGVKVFGYDRGQTPLIRTIASEGIEVNFDDKANKIPAAILQNIQDSLVIYTPAVNKANNKIIQYLEQNGFAIYKRSEVLGALCTKHYNIAVAGTHGKTTSSSMAAHILKFANRDMSAFVGGIVKNYNSNFIANGTLSENSIIVSEADEFDRSFLTLSPKIGVVTSVDSDHLDIYQNGENLHNAYLEFMDRVSEKLIINTEVHALLKSRIKHKHEVYGINGRDIHAENVDTQQTCSVFDYKSSSTYIKELKLPMPGRHNIENALAAITCCLSVGIDKDTIKSALLSFKGIKRRFEYIINSESITFIDDYAHHPTEINNLLTSVNNIYKGKKITAIFQPHLYSRTRDFIDEFASSLSSVDNIVILPIYPAREDPIPGITSEYLLEKIKAKNKLLIHKTEIISYLKMNRPQVLVTIGAGDI
jgi:UDP-N-acetylmuramate--alanine ligase